MWPTKKSKKRDHSEYQVIDEEDDVPIVGDRSSLPRLAFNSFPSPTIEPMNANAAGTSAAAVDVGLRPDLFGGPPELHDVQMRNTNTDVNRSQLVSLSQSTRRWDHIENLDQFFTRVYEYHQRGGFMCVAFAETFALIQFIFLVSFAAFLLQCVDYNVLFRNVQLSPNVTKRTVNDAIVPNCSSQLHYLVVIALIFAAIFWIIRLLRVIYQLLQYLEIRNFYQTALEITADDLANMTWHEVLQRLRQVQPELHLIINRVELTDLDVYQRILRFKNYIVAMTNKELLPPKIDAPFVGNIVYFSNGFKSNVEWLLFHGPWSPWKGPYVLRDEYKNRQYLPTLTTQMEQMVLYMGIINLILSPVIFLYRILYWFFSLAELIKRDPGALGTRRYSNYGRYQLRHFNELDHELKMRLNRSYKAAMQYMDMFISSIGELFAKNIAFVAGSFFAVLVVLSAWDEDVLQVEHVLTVMSVCGVIVVCCRMFIADENLVWCPEWLMNMVIAQIHYVPDSWRGYAHTDRVRRDFAQQFQLKVYFVVEELLSPIITPLLLLFWIRPRAGQFVQFFHQYTVDVEGLGDVCSFAQMDIAKHGDPQWNQSMHFSQKGEDPIERLRNRANEGKTEMSLIHFSLTNPTWQPPADCARFLNQLREKAEKDITNARTLNANNTLLMQSLCSLVPLQYPHGVIGGDQRLYGPGMSRIDYPPQQQTLHQSSIRSLIASMHQSDANIVGTNTATQFISPLDGAAAEMSLHAVYLRQLHETRTRGHDYGSVMRDGSGAGPTTSTSNRNVSASIDERELWAVPQRSVMPMIGDDRSMAINNDESMTEDAPNLFRST